MQWHVVQELMHSLHHAMENMQSIKIPSGESRMILTTCRATIGTVSNSDHNLERSGKAGRSRW